MSTIRTGMIRTIGLSRGYDSKLITAVYNVAVMRLAVIKARSGKPMWSRIGPQRLFVRTKNINKTRAV